MKLYFFKFEVSRRNPREQKLKIHVKDKDTKCFKIKKKIEIKLFKLNKLIFYYTLHDNIFYLGNIHGTSKCKEIMFRKFIRQI